MARDLSPVEQAVLLRRDADAAYANLTAEQREEYEVGIRWLAAARQIYTGVRKRGRPPGSRNRTAEVQLDVLGGNLGGNLS
jgi:hypothetical protein